MDRRFHHLVINNLRGILLHQYWVASHSFWEAFKKGKCLFPIIMAFWSNINANPICSKSGNHLDAGHFQSNRSTNQTVSEGEKLEINNLKYFTSKCLFCVRLDSRFATAQDQNSEKFLLQISNLWWKTSITPMILSESKKSIQRSPKNLVANSVKRRFDGEVSFLMPAFDWQPSFIWREFITNKTSLCIRISGCTCPSEAKALCWGVYKLEMTGGPA